MNRWLQKLQYMLYEREKERFSKYFSEDELLKKYAENGLVKKFVETRGCTVSDPWDKIYAVLPLVSQVKKQGECDPGLRPLTCYCFYRCCRKAFGNRWNGNSLPNTKFLRVAGFALSGPRLECCWLNQHFGVWKEDQAYPTLQSWRNVHSGSSLKS